MKAQGREPPRGIAVDDEGEWHVPIQFGVNARSRAAAEAYAIDANNLTMTGGDFTVWDVGRMWDEGYTGMLEGLAGADELPVSVDGDDLDALLDYDSTYTRNIETPEYKPTGPKPDLVMLYDDSKTQVLIEEIDSCDLVTDEEKQFLRIAAQRHTVLHFERIANYYAHADPGMQRLMENSALVILDFKKAISQGFVRLSHKIAGMVLDEYGSA